MLSIAFGNLLELREFEGIALSWGAAPNPTHQIGVLFSSKYK
jgi:hypothetical protein